MKFIFAGLGIVLFYVLSFAALKLFLLISGYHHYSADNVYGFFGYVYAVVFIISPLIIGGVVGWLYGKRPEKKLLLSLPIYFFLMFFFYYFASNFGGYSY